MLIILFYFTSSLAEATGLLADTDSSLESDDEDEESEHDSEEEEELSNLSSSGWRQLYELNAGKDLVPHASGLFSTLTVESPVMSERDFSTSF